MKDPASTRIDCEPDVEQLKADGRYEEEVHPGDHVAVIPQEGDPALGRTRLRLNLREVARNRGETHVDSEFRQLGLDLPLAETALERFADGLGVPHEENAT